jgi:hypothetical protein
MTGAAYTKQDFALSNNPQVTPEVVEAAVKLQYKKNLIGRNLLGFKSIPVSTVSTNEEGDTEGDINWLSESGALPKLDFTFVRGTKRVRPYGGYFEVTEEQVDDGLEDEVRTMAKNLSYAMSYFEDLTVWNDVTTATGVGAIDAKNPWDVTTGESAGDPLFDVQKAIRTVSTATKGQKPDCIVMSELTFGYLSAFDVIKNRLYNTQGKDGYAVTGQVPTLLGREVVLDDAVDPTDAGQLVVMKKKDIGVWQERKAISAKSIEGALLGKDNIAYKLTAKAKGEPNIKFPKLGCVVSGLYTD